MRLSDNAPPSMEQNDHIPIQTNALDKWLFLEERALRLVAERLILLEAGNFIGVDFRIDF